MKKITFMSAILGVSALGLIGCSPTATNTTVNVNRMINANSNTAIVLNSNSDMMNSNMMNSNMMNSNTMNSNMSMNSNKSVSSADSKFMTEAAQGGMAEVKLGELAASKGATPEIKAFGQRMVVDHGKANADLKTLAAAKGVTLPTDVNSEQKDMYDKLSKLSGAAFDSAYVKGMVEDHEKDVAEFEKESTGAVDSDVKSLAVRTLPTLKSHLEQIKTIKSKMK